MTSDDADGLPLLVLIGTGSRHYREYLLASIATRYQVHLLAASPPGWAETHITGFTEVADMSAAALTDAAHVLAATSQVSGVLTWDEARVETTAAVAYALGLPGSDRTAARRCRDKYLARQALAAAGVPQPRFALARDVTDALAAATRIGYPVVIKPRAAAASYGVKLVRDATELRDSFSFAHDASVPDMPRFEEAVLVEEFLDAPEVSVDSAVYDGAITAVFAARKKLGYAPYFEETAHTVCEDDPLIKDPDMVRTVVDAHKALGLRDAWTHAEFKLTPSGPKVIEINGRLGGDLIPYLGWLASGVDPGLAAADIACGRRPELEADRSRAAAVHFFYADLENTVIGDLGFSGECHPATDTRVLLAAPGDVISPPPKGLGERLALATAVADSLKECHQAIEEAAAAFHIRTAGVA
jgi:biotin carboxylase